MKEKALKRVVKTMGEVTRVNLEPRLATSQRVAKVRGKIDLAIPLKFGILTSYTGTKIWLDF